jgi:F-type H+-transporting ATPase subunit b
MRTWIARFGVCVALGVSALIFAGPARVVHAAEPANQAESAAEQASEEMREEGVPIKFKKDLALWSAVTFLIFLYLLGRYAWKPLVSALDEREGKIRSDISAAESARLKAEQMLGEHSKRLAQVHDEMRELLAGARRDAEHMKQEVIGQAQKEAQAARDRAVQEISRARDSALKDLFDVMANEVAQATRHVLGRSVNAADQDRLIDEALAQFPRRS